MPAPELGALWWGSLLAHGPWLRACHLPGVQMSAGAQGHRAGPGRAEPDPVTIYSRPAPRGTHLPRMLGAFMPRVRCGSQGPCSTHTGGGGPSPEANDCPPTVPPDCPPPPPPPRVPGASAGQEEVGHPEEGEQEGFWAWVDLRGQLVQPLLLGRTAPRRHPWSASLRLRGPDSYCQ